MGLLRKAAVLACASSTVATGALLASCGFGTSAQSQNRSAEQNAQIKQTRSPAAGVSSKRLRPPPGRAKFDKGPAHAKGCAVVRRDAKVVTCSFGKKNAPKTVALFGDSHGVQYTPPLIKLANQRNFRLVTYIRGGCAVADVNFIRSRCNKWRGRAFRLMARQKPDLVVVSTATGHTYRVKRGGKNLNRSQSEPFLRTGMAKTMRKLLGFSNKRGGKTKVVLLRDQAIAPFRPPDCLKKHAKNPSRCAFPTRRPNPPGFDWVGTKRVPKVKIIQPMNRFCGKRWCPAVAGNIVVFRDKYHLTATYARTMTGWLGKRLGI